mmetsp:Transcript_20245/g.56184  ORF Transcript_20245/g.56184 Transcript_20245/m.56184 type:complete len:904 (+) Transcript_20245:66-2777(+)
MLPRRETSGPDMLQFAAKIAVVEEAVDKMAVITITRVGSLRGAVSVKYSTVDGSAAEGIKYRRAAGDLDFQDGEYEQKIQVEIIDNKIWEPTLEFKVVLHSPANCFINENLDLCRIRIHNDDTFPSNKYQVQLQSGKDCIQTISQIGLWFEYVKYNLRLDGVFYPTIATLIFDQLPNAYYYYMLTAKTYLVNVVFNTKDPESEEHLINPNRTLTALFVGVGYVAFIFCLHIWDYTKIVLDIEGKSRCSLQCGLFRMFLNYSTDSREKVTDAAIQVAISKHCEGVASTYTCALDMLQVLGRLVLMVIFVIRHEPGQMATLVFMPLLMAVFGWKRSTALSDASESAGPLGKVVFEMISEACAKYSLMADYGRRPQINETFSKMANAQRLSKVPERQVALNNGYFPKWLGPVFTAFYVVSVSSAVLSGEVSLGVFLATMSVFGKVSHDFESLYTMLLGVAKEIDSLKKIAQYLNMEVDLRSWKKALDEREKAHKAEINLLCGSQGVAAMRAHRAGSVDLDQLPIRITDMSFNYGKRLLFKEVNLSARQGDMIAILALPGRGKSTFMKLLAHSLFGWRGKIFVPMHLRTLYVARDPLLLNRSLWNNLVYGAPRLRDYGFVRNILTKLGMVASKAILEAELEKLKAQGPHVSPISSNGVRETASGMSERSEEEATPMLEGEDERHQDEVAHKERLLRLQRKYASVPGAAGCAEELAEIRAAKEWQAGLAYTEKVLICLARAFIMNPEVIFIQNLFNHFEPHTSSVVMNAITEHRHNRGLCRNQMTQRSRAPRTVFFNPQTKTQANQADAIWQIHSKGIHQIDKDALDERFIPTKPAWFRSSTTTLSSAAETSRDADSHDNALPQDSETKFRPEVTGDTKSEGRAEVDEWWEKIMAGVAASEEHNGDRE